VLLWVRRNDGRYHHDASVRLGSAIDTARVLNEFFDSDHLNHATGYGPVNFGDDAPNDHEPANDH
jgi:hypothetical protein